MALRPGGGMADTVDSKSTDRKIVGVRIPPRAPMEHAGDTHPARGLSYQPALDGLRALAVLAVIGYHDNVTWARGGFLGVDAFFVLSGFLITTLLVLEFRRTGTVRVLPFWGRRARRLLPALVLVVVFVAWYAHRDVVPWERTGIRADGLASLFYVANWRFILNQQSYFTLFSAASPFRHMWSLAIEEQFYLVWPLIAVASLRIARGSLRVRGAISIVGAAASALLMASLYQAGDPSRSYYGTDTHAHTILIGAVLALAALRWRPSSTVRRAIEILGAFALLGVVATMVRFTDTAAAFYRGGSVAFALAVSVVIAAAVSGGPVGAILRAGPLPWIGRLSYGLYLWHWPITVWLVPTRVHVGPLALNALRLGLTFTAAIVSYYLGELPIRTGALRSARRFVLLAPVGVGMAVLALVASAAGATGPPSYLVSIGDPIVCGAPHPEETRAARAEDHRRGPLHLPRGGRALRLLLVGDSTACSLWPGLAVVGRANHIAVDQGSVFGCGVASGEITTTRGEQISLSSNRCDQMVNDTLQKAMARARPTVVVWMSIWEKSDLLVDGKTLRSGTPAGDHAMLARMDERYAQLARGGAKVVIVSVAAPAPNDAQGTKNSSNSVDDASYERLASITRRFAARHPDGVRVVDLASQICPKGPPCPEFVNGERLRPDGRHFTPAAAAHYSRWLLRQILRQAA